MSKQLMRRIFLLLLFVGLIVGALFAYRSVDEFRQAVDQIPIEQPFQDDAPASTSDLNCQLRNRPQAEQAACQIQIGVLSLFVTPAEDRCFPGGTEHRLGYELAMEDLTPIGFMEDSESTVECEIVLVPVDDRRNPEIAATTMNEFANKEVAMVIGSYTSSATLSAAAAADFRKLPLLVISSTSDLITSLDYEWVFRINAPATDLVQQVFSFLETFDRPLTVGIVYENTVFGESNALSLAAAAEERGLVIAVEERYQETLPAQGTDEAKDAMNKIWSSVRLADPDVLFLASNPAKDAVGLVKSIQRLNLRPKMVVGVGGAFAGTDFLDKAGKSAENMLITAQWVEDAPWESDEGVTATDFLARYQAFVTRDEQKERSTLLAARTVQAYTGLMLAHEVIETAVKEKECNPANVSNLRTCIRIALREYDQPETLLGPINFSDATGQNEHTVLIAQVTGATDGNPQLVTIFPLEHATGSFKFFDEDE